MLFYLTRSSLKWKNALKDRNLICKLVLPGIPPPQWCNLASLDISNIPYTKHTTKMKVLMNFSIIKISS